MADERDTGEHFIGSLSSGPELQVQISARRVADLTTQVEFLDREIARYRELLEHERIRHATELGDLQLAADTELDSLRRESRREIQATHDSYRSLLSERQIDFEAALSKAAAKSASTLAAEHERADQLLERERSRRDVLLEAGRKQAIEELAQAHQRTRQSLAAELTKATSSVERLQQELAEWTTRATTAEEQEQSLKTQVAALNQRLTGIERSHELKVGEIESQLATATHRIAAERQRSAATLSELLERSATIATEADRARSEFAAEQAKAAHALSIAQQRATEGQLALTHAADERASQALRREAELESLIVELRGRLTASEASPQYCEDGDDASRSS